MTEKVERVTALRNSTWMGLSAGHFSSCKANTALKTGHLSTVPRELVRVPSFLQKKGEPEKSRIDLHTWACRNPIALDSLNYFFISKEKSII